ncbi:MAG: 5'-nucleotidase C-terminal domain-containing protein [Gammaproteobacteria bacterium]|nr:5'-nucleotidase C-terminal domain-containing protein [Gammaproteobacteria bacterium]MDH5345614.1 5'-nucleotidase C-terminal domain-containing protein [Gammaproteobacteria bacterium]
MLLLGLAACAAKPPAAEPGLTFIHMNDTYRVDAVEDGARGGFGRVVTIVRELKEQGRDVRLLHGGDFLHPSLESQVWNGEQMVEAMNFLDNLAPLYAVPGNHEFDPREPTELVRRLRESRFDWLGDNFSLATGDGAADAALRRAFTFEAGSRKIGIFALTLHPEDDGNLRDHTPFANGSYLEHAERVIVELEAQGADLIIGLTHLYVEDDLEIATLRARHPKFLFIVGGHEHEPEYAEGAAYSAAVMKAASNARTVWRIDVTFGPDGPRMSETMLTVDASIAVDEEYRRISDRWRARLVGLMPFIEARVGEAAVPLDGRETAVRNGDSNWGHFIADQMLTAFHDPPADLALVNGGTLRIDDFIVGDITFEDIGRTFGFSSYLRRMTMGGRDFRRLLEAGYRGMGPSKGYFPQVAGFRVCVDRSRPDGERIVQLQVPGEAGGWREIEAERRYTVIAPDYLYRGGDGYDFSAAREVSPPGSELVYLVLDAIINAQAEGRKVGAPLDPANPRFAILPAGAERCFP